MKLLRRCLSLLLCFALLSVAFSVSVSAEDVGSKDFKVKITDKIITDWGSQTKTFDVYPNNDTKEFTTHEHTKGIPAGTTTVVDAQTFLVEYSNGEPLLKANRESTVTLYNIYIQMMIINNGTGSTTLDRSMSTARLLLYYSDGSYQYIDDITANESTTSGLYNISASFTPNKDVQKIEFITTNGHTLSATSTSHHTVTVYIGEYSSSDMALSISIQSEEAGLLNGIIEWLKSIKNGITNVFDSIVELPGKIWDFIEAGFFKLFVPTKEELQAVADDYMESFEEKFGALAQVTQIIIESAQRIREYDTIDSISIPEVSIPVGRGGRDRFTFGPYEVQIVPENKTFQMLADSCKVLTGIICTCVFLNGLRKRYDEVMEAQD